VRSYSSKPAGGDGAGGRRAGIAGNPLLPAKKGMNVMIWNMRSMPPTPVPGLLIPDQVQGYRVAPGQYTARLTVDGKSQSQSFALKGDPRVPTTDADRQKAVAAAKSVWQRMSEVHQLALDTRSVSTQLTDAAGRARDAGEPSLDKQGKDLASRGDTLAKAMAQDRTKNFQDVINFRNGISAQFAYLQNAIDGSDAEPTKGMTERWTEVESMWGQLKARIDQYMADVEKFNTLLKEKGIPGVVLPKRDKVATD
jgi:hypothetical protein